MVKTLYLASVVKTLPGEDMKLPPMLQDSPSRWDALAQLPAEALVRTLLLKTPDPPGTHIPQGRGQENKTCVYGVTKSARWAANTPGRQQQHLGVSKCLLASCRALQI